MSRNVRTLLFSTLYPSSVRPGHGIFVETRLRQLLNSGEIETKVVAPIPWFFSTNPRFGDYAQLARTPEREMHNGVDVLHPRYVLLPKVGMTLAPFTMALSAISPIRQLQREGFDFDLIDAHYYYPDGVAAALLAKWFDKPFTVTARGSDINLIARHTIPRALIRWAAGQATASISVSKALSDGLASIGVDRTKLMVLRNGVDLAHFYPVPQLNARRALSWRDEPTLLSVGNLVENKGHHIAIEMLTHLPEYRLAITGDGPEQAALKQHAQHLGVDQRVLFTGRIAQKDLPTYYSAADVLILASSREGWPNVLLESMACGTPVVASGIGGIPEVVAATVAGRLVSDRSAKAFSDAVRDLLLNCPPRDSVRQYASQFDWAETTQRQITLFTGLARRVKVPDILV